MAIAAKWGRRELIRSLHTTNRDDARRLARSLSTTADRLFSFIMSDRTLTPEQIDALARDWFDAGLAADEEARSRAGTGRAVYTVARQDQDPVGADLDMLAWLEGDYREAFSNNDFRLVQESVAEMLTEAGVTVDRKSETYRQLSRALLRAGAELMRISKARRVGNYALEPSDPLFRDKASPPAAPIPVDPAASSLPLSRLVDLYVEAKLADGKWTAMTKKNSVNKLKLGVAASFACWRLASAALVLSSVEGVYPRYPPSTVPRTLAAARAAFVLALILSASSSATSAMMPTVRRLASDMSQATKSTPLSRRFSRKRQQWALAMDGHARQEGDPPGTWGRAFPPLIVYLLRFFHLKHSEGWAGSHDGQSLGAWHNLAG